ncbi:MAG TPA: hypothetical protein VEA69_25840 [Tepidisphaeraceae bacterium]|nr:hypothetical protein [Tepidisphaeraceae bacterium]
MRPSWCLVLAVVAIPALAAPAALTLPDAPRVAFVGNTLVERDLRHGYLETLLINAFPDQAITFRNLGWSGDTPCGARPAPASGGRRTGTSAWPGTWPGSSRTSCS